MSDVTSLLPGLMAVRGVVAAALVGVDGEYLSAEASDERLLERMVGTVTSAMAAGEALAGLLDKPKAVRAAPAADQPGDDAASGAAGSLREPEQDHSKRQLMVMYQDGGPILFTPLPGGEHVAVVALSSSHDIGRARFQLRALSNAGA